MKEQNEPSAGELRKFGFIISIMVSLLFGFVFPRCRHHAVPAWPWLTAGIILTAAIVKPLALKKFRAAWIKIGEILGWINARIVMGLVFIVIITPIAVVLRIMKHDSLNLSFDEKAATYRKASKPITVRSMEVPY